MKLTDIKKLRLSAMDLELENEAGIKKVIKFFTSQVKRMSDKTLCYGFYAAIGVYEPQKQKMNLPFSVWVGPLMKYLAAEYQRRMIGWFEHALLKRSQVGGGGTNIKKIEKGLANFVEAIPRALSTNVVLDLKEFIPPNDYLVTSKISPLGHKILKVVRQDAEKAGVLLQARAASFREAHTGLPLVWDDRDSVWVIPSTAKTYQIRDQLGSKGYGFKWNSKKRRWEIHKITPTIQKNFDVPEPTAIIDKWFWTTWYPKNHSRFTIAFSDYARNLQSSYRIFFSNNRKKLVKFDRHIETVDDAIEELRYRYIGRRGRESWLDVIDEFMALRKTPDTNTDSIILKIDLLNGMQHSNGLFMEHFPGDVKNWYKAFLNAKFAAPDPQDLARYIPDKDFKELLLFLTSGQKKIRDPGWGQDKGDWHLQEKELPPGTNWRKKGYPRYPGDKGKQVDRFSPKVQKGLQPPKERKQDPFISDLWRRRED